MLDTPNIEYYRIVSVLNWGHFVFVSTGFAGLEIRGGWESIYRWQVPRKFSALLDHHWKDVNSLNCFLGTCKWWNNRYQLVPTTINSSRKGLLFWTMILPICRSNISKLHRIERVLHFKAFLGVEEARSSWSVSPRRLKEVVVIYINWKIFQVKSRNPNLSGMIKDFCHLPLSKWFVFSGINILGTYTWNWGLVNLLRVGSFSGYCCGEYSRQHKCD